MTETDCPPNSNDELRAENERLHRAVRAAQDLETYLINKRCFVHGGEPMLAGFPTAELAMLSDALDSLELRPDAQQPTPQGETT